MTTVTSDQSNLKKGRITTAHGRFNAIRQLVPVCTPPNILISPDAGGDAGGDVGSGSQTS